MHVSVMQVERKPQGVLYFWAQENERAADEAPEELTLQTTRAHACICS